jgi:hypothetical protein
MTRPVDSYTVASGQPIYAGRAGPSIYFDPTKVTVFSDTGGYPTTTEWNTKPFVVELHGSGGPNYTTGRQFRVPVDGFMTMGGTSPTFGGRDYDNRKVFGFSACIAYDHSRINLRPNDEWYNDASAKKEAFHMGFVMPDGKLHLFEERRYRAMYKYALDTLPIADKLGVCLTGGSMGGWGTASFGLRLYDLFAALYPDRPRWNGGKSTIGLAMWNGTDQTFTQATAPQLAPEDGGGSSWDYLNAIAYVSNQANKVRWIGWCLGRNDNFATMAESDAMIAALRQSGRAFAYYWNDGQHGEARLVEILRGYPFGTFRIGTGWPCFSNFSRDQDPAVHKAGGINIDLTFRNVQETPTGWSCEVTCVTPWTYVGYTNSKKDAQGNYTGLSTTTVIAFPYGNAGEGESEINGIYVGSTLTINGETRTITTYDAETVMSAAGATTAAGSYKRVTVDAPFSTAPAPGTAYTLTRRPQDAACTVTVAPVSEIYTGSKTPKTITIPNSNTWVPVQFP